MPLTTGTRLGPYEINAPIGAGGMGEVYRARDTRLARDVAVKVLPARLADDRVSLARFEREARAVAALSHPNILSIFDVGHDGGMTYAVTELLEGETLRQRLQEGALAPRKAVEYAAQIAQGLAAAHEKGIVHRDLKPENVFLMPDGRVKILDFGLARQADEGAPPDTLGPTVVVVTDAGVVAGTPAYMAPEQVRGQAVTPQVDIFAFGSMLFEMLTGQRAFKGQAAAEIMNAVLKDDPPDILTLAPAVPVALSSLVRHCLEKQPGERFQSARDLAFNLQVLAGAPTPTPAPGLTPLGPNDGDSTALLPQAVSDGAQARPHRRLVVGLALALPVAIAAGVGAGWVLQARQRPAPPHFTRVSYTQKAIFRAAFAPEGGTLAYSAAVNGNEPEVFVLNSEYPSARPLGLRNTHLLAISRKGEMALLTRAHSVGTEVLEGTLARMPIGAAAPRELLDGVRDADWLPDRDALVVVRTSGGKDYIEWPGTSARYQTDGYLTDLHVSPSGDRVAFVDHPYGWEGRGTLMVLDRGGRAASLAGPFPFARGVAWTAGGKEVLFSASVRGADMTAIFGVEPGGRVRQLLEGSGSLTIHDVAPTGQWLVSRDDRRAGVRALVPGTTVERELSWLDQSSLAAFSDDARTVLFTELAAPAGQNGTVCLRNTDGAPTVALGAGLARDLSADGRLALVVTFAPPQLLLYPTGAGANRVLPSGTIAEYRSAAFFPDGRRVLSCGAGKATPSRCFVQDIDGGAPRAVTGTADAGIVSPNGEKIIAWSPEGAAVIYPVAGGEPQPVRSLTSEDVPIRWTADGQSVLVYQPHKVPCVIERVNLASGRREVVRQVGGLERVGVLSVDSLRVTPDLASYAYTYTRLLSTLFTIAQ